MKICPIKVITLQKDNNSRKIGFNMFMEVTFFSFSFTDIHMHHKKFFLSPNDHTAYFYRLCVF